MADAMDVEDSGAAAAAAPPAEASSMPMKWPEIKTSVIFRVAATDEQGNETPDTEPTEIMIPKEMVAMCSALRTLIEDMDTDEETITIPLVHSSLGVEKSKSVDGRVKVPDKHGEAKRLQAAIDYFHEIAQDGFDRESKHKAERLRMVDGEKEFFDKFGGGGQDCTMNLIRLTLLANYLGYEQLVYATLCASGAKISAASPLEVCKMFGRDKELTPEELEETYARMPFLRPPAEK